MQAAPGVLAVWHDLAPGHESEFEAWYQRQHVPERLQVPGFQEARRYRALNGSPRYCAFYWLASAEVLRSPAYLERLAQPSAWTQRVMPWFRAMGRTPCTLVLERGAGSGGAMSWLALLEDPARVPLPELMREAFERLMDAPGLVRMQLWQGEPHVSAVDNPEQKLRRTRDQVARWIVFLEAATAAAARLHAQALHDLVTAAVEPSQLLRAPVYRLLSGVRAEDAPQPWPDERLDLAATRKS
jgi:hypothetical protein